MYRLIFNENQVESENCTLKNVSFLYDLKGHFYEFDAVPFKKHFLICSGDVDFELKKEPECAEIHAKTNSLICVDEGVQITLKNFDKETKIIVITKTNGNK